MSTKSAVVGVLLLVVVFVWLGQVCMRRGRRALSAGIILILGLTAATLVAFAFPALHTGATTPGGAVASQTDTAVAARRLARIAVVPVAPRLTMSACSAVPQLTLASTPGIAYSVGDGGPYAVGQVVLVEAHTGPGVEFTAAPAGWTRVSDTSETYRFVFAALAGCLTPARPAITQAHCVPGTPAVSGPSLATLDTPGITYSAFPDAPYTAGQQVTITATAQPGGSFSTIHAIGWVHLSQSRETYTVTFAAAPHCAAKSSLAGTPH